MKKIISVFMAIAMTLSMAVPVMANPDITVTVDGVKVEFDAQPEMVNERTMVPMRAIFEELGAVVSWDQPTQTVTAVTPEKTVVATVGETVMTVNSEEKVMDVAPYVKDDRTYVPARFVSEALDCNVDWDQDTYTVIVTSQADEDFLYTYSAIKDFTMKNGEYDEEREIWSYYEVLDDIDVHFVYDKTRTEFAIQLEESDWTIFCDVIATRGGVCQLETAVINEYGESDFIVGFADGDFTVLKSDLPSISNEGMLKMTDACVDVMDKIIQIIDPECALSDFGVVPISPKN